MISAALYDRLLAGAERRVLARWRRELLGTAHGEVLEIGAGTGANLPYYGPAVRRLVLLEPDRAMRGRLRPRAGPGQQVLAGRAAQLPLPDASVDTVVSTLVLCSVGLLEPSLAEVRRVLRPGGGLLLIEHVAARIGTRTRMVQHALTPLWRRLAGGCSLERETRDALERAGFDTGDLVDDSLGVPVLGPVLRGTCRLRA